MVELGNELNKEAKQLEPWKLNSKKELKEFKKKVLTMISMYGKIN